MHVVCMSKCESCPCGQVRHASGDDFHDNTHAQASSLPLPVYSSNSTVRCNVGVIIKISRYVRTPNGMHPKNQGVKLRASSGPPSQMKHRMVRKFHHDHPAPAKDTALYAIEIEFEENARECTGDIQGGTVHRTGIPPRIKKSLQYITNVSRH